MLEQLLEVDVIEGRRKDITAIHLYLTTNRKSIILINMIKIKNSKRNGDKVGDGNKGWRGTESVIAIIKTHKTSGAGENKVNMKKF